MKHSIILALAALLMAATVQAQIENPVSWSFSTEDIVGQEATLVFRATIDPPWHLYSANLPAGGPIPTKPYYNESEAFSLVDGIVEIPKPKIKFDKGFQMDVGTLEGTAEFKQRVRFQGGGSQVITGEIEWQACDDEVCLPPQTEDFSFTVNLGGEAALEEEGAATAERCAMAAGDAARRRQCRLTGRLIQAKLLQGGCGIPGSWHLRGGCAGPGR
jgi:DsbC/DsbD-like thiol-disulfide interchange protein